MKIGDKIEVRNIGSTEWANASVTGTSSSDLITAKVDHPGHELDGKNLTLDSQHYRLREGKQ